MPQGPGQSLYRNSKPDSDIFMIDFELRRTASHRSSAMRMAEDSEGGDKTPYSVCQLREALLNIKTWVVFAFGVLVTMQSPVLTVHLPCPIDSLNSS